jgi:peptidoglycan/LPS O-acetylase OafA/YrhL
MISGREHHVYYRWAFGLLLGLIIPWFQEISWNWMASASKVVAKYSYGVYLSHVAVQMTCFETLRPLGPAVQYTALIVLSILVPFALYHLIEAPGIRLGHRVVTKAGWDVPLVKPSGSWVNDSAAACSPDNSAIAPV